MLVCDLQGVFTQNPRDSCYECTDPVIHYKSAKGRKNVYGRTDRGQKGIDDFYKSHHCSPLCQALDKRWIKPADAKPSGMGK